MNFRQSNRMLKKNQINNLNALLILIQQNINIFCIAFINTVLKDFVSEHKVEQIQNVECEGEISKNMVETIIEIDDRNVYEALLKFYIDLRDHLVELLNVFPGNDDLKNNNGVPVKFI